MSDADAPQCEYPAMAPPVSLSLLDSDDHACSYLPNRIARTRAFAVRNMPGKLYHDFMNAGFRRSGLLVYQPVCPGCRQCLPIRVPVGGFKPSKSQRRCWRRNQDLLVRAGALELTDEKFDLYQRYMTQWHQSSPDDHSREALESFLYQSPVDTVEFTYRDPATGALLAVGICDLSPESLSSVYFYHDPAAHKRGLGVFGALYEIDFARTNNIPYYYLGYWVAGCSTMDYKADYRPHEVLHPDGTWQAGETVRTERR
jgi:arginyl-tRNA--protein-N-Asp/Glu arginylyltransferase